MTTYKDDIYPSPHCRYFFHCRLIRRRRRRRRLRFRRPLLFNRIVIRPKSSLSGSIPTRKQIYKKFWKKKVSLSFCNLSLIAMYKNAKLMQNSKQTEECMKNVVECMSPWALQHWQHVFVNLKKVNKLDDQSSERKACRLQFAYSKQPAACHYCRVYQLVSPKNPKFIL